MFVGVNVAPSQLSRLARYPGIAVTRVFYPPGAGLPTWNTAKLQAIPAALCAHVSFKDWLSDEGARAAVNAHLSSLPAGRQEWLTYHHEPEGDGLDVALYRSRCFKLAEMVRAHPRARSQSVYVVPVQTLQWTAATTAGKGQGDPSTWWAGVGLPGMDCYADSWRSAYPDPAQFVAPALRLARAAGRALIVPELGAIRLPGDTTGQRRADWIRAVASVLRDNGCASVSWWDDLGSNGNDFRLEDAPSRQAWIDVVKAG